MGVGQPRRKAKGRDEVFSDGRNRRVSYPYLERRARAGGLSTICSRAARESRSAASCARTGGTHRPPRERLARVRWPTVTRAPVFPIALSRCCSPSGRTPESGSRIGKGHPDLNGVGAVQLAVSFPSSPGEQNSRGHRGFQSRNRPASPSLPAGANSRVTPVLARSHSRAPVRANRTCSPSWRESAENSIA